jgi:hypothetical protein
MRSEADMEARRERREQERTAGLAFSQTLRERLEAGRIRVEDLMEPGPSPNETGYPNPKGGDGAA